MIIHTQLPVGQPNLAKTKIHVWPLLHSEHPTYNTTHQSIHHHPYKNNMKNLQLTKKYHAPKHLPTHNNSPSGSPPYAVHPRPLVVALQGTRYRFGHQG